jgi:putative ABC transport system permease protein
MSLFSKLSFRNLSKNRGRTAITVIGVVLATAMICGLMSLIASFQGYLIKDQIAKVGDWHLQYKNINPTEVKEIVEDPEVKDYVFAEEVGYAKIDNKNSYKPYLYLVGASDDFTEIIPLYLTEGKLPASANEIILPSNLIGNAKTEYKIGDTIKLDLGQRYPIHDPNNEAQNHHQSSVDSVGDVANSSSQKPQVMGQDIPFNMMDDQASEELKIEQTKTYTISGFYQRSYLEPYSAPGYMALTKADSAANSSEQVEPKTTLYLQLKNPKEVYNFVKDYAEIGNNELNSSLLRLYGISGNNHYLLMISSLTIIFMAMIILGSIVLINNAFTISLAERTKQFGLLSSIGASRKQIRRTIFVESLMISLIGIPFGVLGGLLGIKLTLIAVERLLEDVLMTSDYAKVPLELVVSSKAILISAALALITVLISAWIPAKRASRVTAIEAIRQIQDVVAKPVKVSKTIYKVFGLPGFLANKYFKRSRKKYRSTIVSLALSIILFLSAYTFTSMMQRSAQGIYQTRKSDLQYTMNIESETASVEDLKTKIEGLAAVTDVSVTVNRNYYCLIEPELLEDKIIREFETGDSGRHYAEKAKFGDQENFLINLDFTFVEDEVFAEMLKQFDLTLAEYLAMEETYPLIQNRSFYFDPQDGKYVTADFFKTNQQGEFDLIVFNKYEDYSYSRVTNEDSDQKTGEPKTVYRNYEKDTEKVVPFQESLAQSEKIGLKYFVEDVPDQFKGNERTNLILPLSKLASLSKINEDRYFQFYINSSNNLETENDLSNFNQQQEERGHYTNFVAQRQASRNVVMIVNIFCYGFIALISLIALTNVFNTITTNINLRTRDFAMLKSVGMSKKGMRKMMVFECFLYGTRSLLWGLPLALGVSYLIYKSIDRAVTQPYQIPWLAILIAAVAVFIFVAVSMVFALRQVYKKNIIESLKNENN